MSLDLQKIVSELVESGLSQSELARQVKVKQPTIWRYISGESKSCKYATGARLIELHRQRVLEGRV